MIFIIALLFVCINNRTYASFTLEEIVDKINNSDIISKWTAEGITFSAIATSDSITMDITTSGGTNYTETYTLEDGHILKGPHYDTYYSQMFVQLLMNGIGQLHGYEDGEIYTTIYNVVTKDQAYTSTNYNLENDGIEFKNFIIRVDIDKIINLQTFDKSYFVGDDVDTADHSVSLKLKKNKMLLELASAINPTNKTQKFTFYGPKADENNIYQSIINTLDYLNRNTEYFKTNYPNIIEGTKEFEGYTIKVIKRENYNDDSELIYASRYKSLDAYYYNYEVEVTVTYGKAPRKGTETTNPANPSPIIDDPIVTEPGAPSDDNDVETPGKGDASKGGQKEYPNAGIKDEQLIYILLSVVLVASIGVVKITKISKNI